MTHALYLDGAWRAVAPYETVTNAEGVAVSAETFAGWSDSERETFGARAVPEPNAPPAGKIETSRILGGPKSGPRWIVAYVDAPAPLPAPVPESVADWQFAAQAAFEDIITRAEGLAWAARGEVPASLDQAVTAQIPDADDLFEIRMLLAGAKSYERSNPLVPMLGFVFGKDAAGLDQFWRDASQRGVTALAA